MAQELRDLRAAPHDVISAVAVLHLPDQRLATRVNHTTVTMRAYTDAEIAAALHLASGTVKNHLSSVFLKLGVRDRTRAVLRALELGLLEG